MSDWWDSQTATDPAPVAKPPPKPRAAKPAAQGIPLADAWVLFRWDDETGVNDPRVVRGAWLNDASRKRGPLVTEPKDWTHDLPCFEFGSDPQAAWREFVRSWLLAPNAGPELWAAAEAWAAIEGLDHLARMAATCREAEADKQAAKGQAA